MSIEQVGLQLGIAGLLLVVIYRISLKLIESWAKSEAARTSVLAAGLESIVTKVDNYAISDAKHHLDTSERIAKIEGALMVVLMDRKTFQTPNQTPIAGVPIIVGVGK